MRFITICLVVFCFTSCNKSIQYIDDINTGNSAGFAEVYFINTSLENGTPRGRIYLNNVLIGKMGLNSFLKSRISCDPNDKVEIRAEIGKSTVFELPVNPGEVHYFDYEVEVGPNAFKVFLRKLDNENGVILIEQIDQAPIYKTR